MYFFIGSIIVIFDIIASTSGVSLNDAVTTLQMAAQAGTLTFMTPDGSTLTVTPSSFSVAVTQPTNSPGLCRNYSRACHLVNNNYNNNNKI